MQIWALSGAHRGPDVGLGVGLGPTGGPWRCLFSTLDLTHFNTLLASNLSNVTTTAETEEELDYLINRVILAIHSIYITSATRSLPQGRGQPWWNEKYKAALQDYWTGLSTQKDFRQVIKQTQQQYWRDKISATTTSKEVFDMLKWYKITGSYRSPLIKDPQQPDNPLVVDIQEKHDILACNLL
jgi:hypothetical protein